MKSLKMVIFSCLCIVLISTATVSYAVVGKVTGRTVRIRESADASSKIVTNAYRHDELSVLEDVGDWYKVKYEGKEGYISKEFVEVKSQVPQSNGSTQTTPAPETKPSTEASEPVSESTPVPSSTPVEEEKTVPETTQITNSETTNDKIVILKESSLKLLPIFSAREVGIVSKDAEVIINSEVNNWVQITVGSNKGWVLKNSVSNYKSNQSSTPSIEVVENDKKEEEQPENKPTPVVKEGSVPNNDNKGYINTDTVRVRESAGGKIIGNIDINDVVTILGEEGDWYKISSKKFETGYVSKSLVTVGTSSRSMMEPRSGEEAENLEPVEPQMENKKVAENVEVLPEKLPDMSATDVEVTPETLAKSEPVPEQTQESVPEPVSNVSKGQEVVDYAKSFLGCRYVSGGTSPSGFDCSGFTQYVFKNFGYSLSRVASGQASNGVEVSRDNLQVGDIILFQDYGRSCIGHVGIYIGDGNFIHAANPSRGVVTDNLNSNSYYNVRYVTARRIVQ